MILCDSQVLCCGFAAGKSQQGAGLAPKSMILCDSQVLCCGFAAGKSQQGAGLD